MKLDARSIPYRILENGLQLGGIVVFSVLASSGGGSMNPLTLGSFLLVWLVLAVGWQVAYIQRYEYELTPDTFDIQSGVLSRREREIPFERIQNVDIAQNVVQRALGIAELRLETAGGGSTEARLQYVSRPEAARLQEAISQRKQRGTDSDRETTDEVLFELDPRELAILGVTSANFRFLGAIIVMVSLVAPPVARQISPGAEVLLLFGPGMAVLIIVALWLTSGAQSVLRYYGFRLLGHEDELRYERGLFQRYNGTIPRSKIQTLMLQENVLARTLGYATLVIETAGSAPGQGDDTVESAVPIAKRKRVLELAGTIEDIGELSFTSPPKRARTRYLARYAIGVAIVTGVAFLFHSSTGRFPLWYLVAGLFVLVPPAAHLKWVNLGYHYDENYIVTQSGFWNRRTTIVPYYRVQTVSNTQTIFQRRRNLGTLAVDTASSGGLWGGDAIALDIDADTADQLRETVHDRFRNALARRQLER